MSAPALHLRSYRSSTGLDRHAHAQWVLSLCGEMEVEVSGHAGRLSEIQGVFVASGERHDQSAREPNRFLVVDCPQEILDDDTHESLCRQPWLAVPLSLRQRLVTLARYGTPAEVMPLLLAHFSPSAEQSRLHWLCARIEAAPAARWTVQAMSELTGLSVSRLHAVFRAYFGMSPQAWLSACRLRWAKHALETSSARLIDIAIGLGYSEQSAFTRAFHREVGIPPGEWRDLHQ